MSLILVIDDEKLARVTLRKILERADHKVIEASNGIDGFAMLRTNQCDLIITDIILPDQEGADIIAELQHDFPGVHIIAISGGGQTRSLDLLKLARQFNDVKVLAKPFSQDALLSAVDAAVSRCAEPA